MRNSLPAELGIVIIGKNEGHHLADCLEVIPRDFPCIYVDSASEDNSLEIAKRYPVHTMTISGVPLNPARARNAGALELLKRFPHLKYLQFIDGDTVICPGWLEYGKKILDERRDLAVLSGRLNEKGAASSIYKIWSSLEWRNLTEGASHCGGNCMLRAEDFVLLNGFNSNLMAGEEPEFCERLRRRKRGIFSTPQPMGVHDSSIDSFTKFWKRCERAGYAFQQVAKLSRERGWTLYHRENISNWIYGGLIPLIIMLFGFVNLWISAAIAMVYPLGVLRIFWKERHRLPAQHAWIYAVGCILSKFPGFIGALRFHLSRDN